MNTRRFVSLIIFLATLFALSLLPVSIAFASGATWTNQTTGTSVSGLSWQSMEPTGGTVALNDVEITGLGSGDLRRARRRMGMIFQEYALVERLTVMENVLSGRLGYVGFWRTSPQVRH